MNLIDTHIDTFSTLIDKNEPFSKNKSHVSVDLLNNYNKKGIYCAIWLNEQRRKNAYQETIECIDFYYNQLELNNSSISHCNNFEEFKNTFNSGKIASLLCLEGAESIEGSMDLFYNLYEKGVRLITLTWNNDNAVASGILGSSYGLTEFGKSIVKEMNKLNMIIDVSHLNEKGFFDCIDLATKPIIASHSNCYRIHDNVRNLNDAQLKELKNTGSYVSVNLHTPFISNTNTATIYDLLRHIDYLINFLGEDFISIGSDFDGTKSLPTNITNIGSLSLLYNLLKNTYNSTIADKIFYLNQLEFLRKTL